MNKFAFVKKSFLKPTCQSFNKLHSSAYFVSLLLIIHVNNSSTQPLSVIDQYLSELCAFLYLYMAMIIPNTQFTGKYHCQI